VTAEIEYPRGHPCNPLSEEELTRKFQTLVDPVLGRERSAQLRNAIEHVESLANIQELTNTFLRQD
jgi:2-methylcitrate dehydratase